MKEIIFAAALTLLTGAAFSQRTSIKWSPESKTDMAFVSFVNGSGSDMIKLCMEVPTGIRFIKRDVSVTPVLSRYNDKLMEKPIERFTASEKDVHFNDLLSVKGRLFLFTNHYDKSEQTTEFFSQEINILSLQATGRSISLGVFDAVSKKTQSKVDYELSKDSSRILMFGLAPSKSKKDNERHYMGVYDNQMKKLWDKTVTLPYMDKYITVLERLVTNEGKVGIIIKHYDQEISREAISKDGTKVPSYKTKLLLYDGNEAAPKEYLLDLGNKFIHTLSLTEDNEQSLQLFGLYKDKYNGYITGYFIAGINKQSGAVSTHNVVSFPEDLVHLVKVDRQGSEKERDPGISNDFKLKQVEETADGTKHYILEYLRDIWHAGTNSYSANGGGSYTPPYWEYQNGDIIVVSIQKNNTNVLARIPKMQSSIDTRIYSSCRALPYNDKLVVFYNDNEDNADKDIEKRPDILHNFKKSMFIMATIDKKGLVTRTPVYSNRDMPLVTAVNVSRLLDKNRIGLYAQRFGGLFTSAKDMVGILELK